MTKSQHISVFNTRPLYNPIPGTVSAEALVKDAGRYQMRLSDHCLGLLYLAIDRGSISIRAADKFETMLKEGALLRKSLRRGGHPFIDPEGNLIRYKVYLAAGTTQEITLHGERRPDDGHGNYNLVSHTLESLQRLPRYTEWGNKTCLNTLRIRVPTGTNGENFTLRKYTEDESNTYATFWPNAMRATGRAWTDSYDSETGVVNRPLMERQREENKPRRASGGAIFVKSVGEEEREGRVFEPCEELRLRCEVDMAFLKENETIVARVVAEGERFIVLTEEEIARRRAAVRRVG